jgi:hypothetical protein
LYFLLKQTKAASLIIFINFYLLELSAKLTAATKPLSIQTTITIEPTKQQIMENTSMENRANESFMHTAQKLLEKAKQAQMNKTLNTTISTAAGQEEKIILKLKSISGDCKSVQENLEKSIMNETDAKANL